MPRPSRLSEGVLEKIPTDKEAQRDHTLKRLAHQGFPDGLAEDRYRNVTDVYLPSVPPNHTRQSTPFTHMAP